MICYILILLISLVFSFDDYIVNSSVGLNIRTGPAVSYPRVYVASNGDTLSVQSISNGWAKLKDGNYCSMQYLIPTSKSSSQASKSNQNCDYYEVTDDYLNIRSGPGTNYPVQYTTPNGGTLCVVSISNGWAKLKDGNYGYASLMRPKSSGGSYTPSTPSITKVDSNGIPHPIAWQQSSRSGAEKQRLKYLPSMDNWSDYPFNRGSETGNTIGLAGCSLLATVNLFYYKTGKFIHPNTLAKFAIQRGFRVTGYDGVRVEFFPKFISENLQQDGMRYLRATYSADTVLQHIRNGGQSISCVPGHWVAIVDYNPSTKQYLLLDSSIASKRTNSISWTNKENGVAWLPESKFKSGDYSIQGTHSNLIEFSR